MSDWEDVAFGPSPTASMMPVVAPVDDWEDVGAAMPSQQGSQYSPKPIGQRSYMDQLSMTAANAMGAVPFGDEIMTGAGAALMAPFSDETFGQIYDRGIGNVRGAKAQFSEENPVLSVFNQLAAGAPAMVGTAGLGGSRVLGQLAANTGLGALFGLGEEGGAGRLTNAGIGGALGVAATGAGKIAEGIATSAPVQRGYGRVVDELSGLVGDESGALFSRAARQAPTLPNLTPGEAAIAKMTYQVPLEKIAQTPSKIASALSDGVPILPAEAADSGALYALQKLSRSNDLTSDIAEGAIQGRQRGASERIMRALEGISPESNVDDAFTGLVQGAKNISKTVKEVREVAAAPAYRAAKEARPIVASPELDEVMKSSDVQSIIRQVKSKFPTRYGDLPDNHIEIVDRVKKGLGASATKAKAAGDNDLASDYIDLKNQLVKAIDFPEYKAARKVFQDNSKAVNEIAGTFDYESGKKTRGILTELLNVDENLGDLSRVGKKLFNMNEKQLSRTREVFEKYEKAPQLEAAARAHLQAMLDGGTRGMTKLRTTVLTQAGGKKLTAMVGKERYDALKKLVELEDLIARADKRTFVGSPTNSLQNTQSRLGSFIKSVLSPGAATEKIANAIMKDAASMNDQTLIEIAQILSDPKLGMKSMQNIAQYRTILEPRLASTRAAIRAAEKAGTSQLNQGMQKMIQE